eukprot:CAMPEP_0194429850 /NCGR_PEP_ID=MMETSP0176-20130528/50053_1 /TAXON_ID=216777 /ORGANISM="Proboscia alata, Strain PI-D3" /LENGTH=71 /DNA_ID=CAMNT_0039243381 /DNA_START=1 /DNA_END=212 /DNA_ORIENTATION=+
MLPLQLPLVAISPVYSPIADDPDEFSDAVEYVTKVKNRFHIQKCIYKSFLDIMHKYEEEHITIEEVLDKIS